MKNKLLFLVGMLSLFLFFGISQASALMLVIDSDPNPGGMYDVDVNGELNDYVWGEPNWNGSDHNWQYITPNAEGVELEWLTALLGGTDPGAYTRYEYPDDDWTVHTSWDYAVLKFGNGGGVADHLAILNDGSTIDFDDFRAGFYYDDTIQTNNGLSHITFFGGTPGEPGTPVPEPATMLLLGAGLVGFASMRKRLRKR